MNLQTTEESKPKLKTKPISKPFSYGNVTGVILYDIRRIKKGGYPVKYRVIYQRTVKYFDSGFALSVKEWDTLEGTHNKNLKDTREMIYAGYQTIENHVKELVKNQMFSFEALDKRLGKGNVQSLPVAFDLKIARLRKNGQVSTATVYECSKNSLIDYHGSDRLKFSTINVEWLKEYEKWFLTKSITKKDKKRSYASLSIYLRSLRSIFNDAKLDGTVSEAIYPFGRGKYEIPSSAGRKMAYNLDQIGTLMNIPIKEGSSKGKMRDLWLFSYLCNGMNVKDIVCLKWGNILEDEISYYREKTARTTRDKKPISAPILPKMREIIERWGTNDRNPNNYVFGYLTGKPSPETIRKVTQNLTRQINKNLKSITKGKNLPLITSYTARHSFATVLQRSGVNVEFISESLGHRDTKTTRNYLAGFEKETRRKINTKLTDYEGGK